MDVQETRVRQILEGAKQYLVPLYQRPYAWEVKQRDRLWSDILELAEERATQPDASHFMGSLVLSLGNVSPGGTEFLVVDGQQRLTTLSILLCALRDYLKIHRADDPMAADAIHERYLADRYKSGDARLKVLPTQADRNAFRAIVDGSVGADTDSGVGSAYSFFRRQLELVSDPGNSHNIDRIQDAILGGLVFVSITAKQEDNVYRIFESLNNTGLKLTQGDLVRNYLFMRLGVRGEAVYLSWWLPMQSKLSSSDLELLFWLDAVMRNPNVKQSDTYAYQRDRLSNLNVDTIEGEVERFARLADLLVLIRQPHLESDVEVAGRLARLDAWGTGTVVPILLVLLDRRWRGTATSEEVAAALATLESFLVRRTIVGGPNAGVNGILLRAALEIQGDRRVDSALLEYLSTGRKYFATDDRLRAAVLREPFYLRGRTNQQKLILAWIEESLHVKERVDTTKSTIEHVLPQTLTPDWREMLSSGLEAGQTIEDLHTELVHTIGNLTLTGYNSELSNRDFDFKRKELELSGYTLNREIAVHDRWGRAEIIERGALMADRAVMLWTSPLNAMAEAETGVRWELAHQALMAVPAGSWTTYGDLAAIVGTHPVPMGQHLAAVEVPGAWRVLQSGGTVSPGFRWTGKSTNADPQTFLEAEGVVFNDAGQADPSQRLSAADLASRLGIGAVEDDFEDSAGVESDFIEQLSHRQAPESVHGVLELMRKWRQLGGFIGFGNGQEISCFLMAPRPDPGTTIWPISIYPSGTAEVVFQWLRTRGPFREVEMRRRLLDRFNGVAGVDLPVDSLERRPSFSIDLLATVSGRDAVFQVLEWFFDQVVDFAGKHVEVSVED